MIGRWRGKRPKGPQCRLCSRELTEDDWIRPWRLCRWPCHLAIVSGLPWFRTSGMRADAFLRREGIRTETRTAAKTYQYDSREFTTDELALMREWVAFHELPGSGSFQAVEAPLIAWYTTQDLDGDGRLAAWRRAEAALARSGDWGAWAGVLIDEWEERHKYEQIAYWNLVEELLKDLPDHDGGGLFVRARTVFGGPV